MPVFLLLVALALVASTDWRPGRVTAYPARCTTTAQDGNCVDRIQRVEAWERYQIDTAAQRVVVLEESGSVWGLSGCTVFDKKHWQCSSGGDYYRETKWMRNGRLFAETYSSIPIDGDQATVYLSYWRWWWLKLTL